MKQSRILIIGGGYSGVLAARRLALKTDGLPVDITLINGSDRFVERIRFHQLATNQHMQDLPMSRMLAGRHVRFMQGWVTRIDPLARSVMVQSGKGLEQIDYDYLVYALGSFVDLSRVPGAAENALSLSSAGASLNLAERLPRIAETGGRVVVCGAGLTGVELASEIAETYPGLDLSLVTRGDLGADLSKLGRAYLHEAFERKGVDVLDNTAITRIEPGRVVYHGGSLNFDLCVWAGGFGVPALAREAGLTVNTLGQIAVDDHLRSVSHPEIVAVGDAADLSGAIPTPIRMACATSLPMGGYAGDEIAAQLRGKNHAPYEFAYGGRCISLGRQDGLLQVVDADDHPSEMVLTGQSAVWAKEAICRFALWQVRNDQLMYFPRRPFWERRSGPNDLAASAQVR